MRKIYLIILLLLVFFSCKKPPQQNKKGDLDNLKKDSTWLEYSEVNKTDSLKMTIHYNTNLDSSEHQKRIKDRVVLFLFAFYKLPPEEFKKIIFLEDDSKYKKMTSKAGISTVLMAPDSTSHTFYVRIKEKGTYHLTGMIDDNIHLKGEAKVRKIGTYIKKDIVIDSIN